MASKTFSMHFVVHGRYGVITSMLVKVKQLLLTNMTNWFRKRTNFTSVQMDALMYHYNEVNSRPTYDEVDQLCQQTGLEEKTIKVRNFTIKFVKNNSSF